VTALLTAAELGSALADLPDWTGDEQTLKRTVTAADFPGAIRIVDEVAVIAEELDHHPDIDIRWTTLTFALTTHFKGGVTERDVALAHRIDDVLTRQEGA
jgi:4a-hydroxytetrahydrobiopterin dehydratase